MREIIFRGKRVSNGEWVMGGFHQRFGEAYIIGISQRGIDGVEVIPETVGQYIGLTDKNGKKIFEGDIVFGAACWLERMKNGIVAFRDGSFGVVWCRGNVEQFNPFTSMCNIEYEVIGNIHDNPELLKDGE